MQVTAAAVRTRARYKVLGMAVLLAAVTYTDRVCISVTAPHIMRDLHLSQVQMSFVFSAFTLAYGIFEIPTGWWGDRIGTRRVLTRIVAWWSTFTVLTGAAYNYVSLLAIRFLFGCGEAGAWPNVARTFSVWFPLRERGTAQGVFFMGAHLAGGLTPLLVTAMLVHFHWRALFAMFGSVGLVWAIAWWKWFRDTPADHPSANAAETAYIESGCAAAPGHPGRTEWKRLLGNGSVAALCAMYFTQSYGFNFYITWLPSYLRSVRGFSGFQLGVLAGLPLMLSVVADGLGGLTTDRMSRRYGLRLGRALVGGASLGSAGLLLMAGVAVANPVASAVLIGFAGAASNFLLGAAWGTCIDIGGRHSGTVSAAMNTSGQIGGILCPIVIGSVAQHWGNWTAPLYLTAALYLGGALCWTRVRPGEKAEAA
jgi:MFS family permease